ncbi:MAG: hypothetical protein P1V81_11570 [Planctomycetota bacterium]|nr:hypothetical protein [Planctomycetota bacterium]
MLTSAVLALVLANLAPLEEPLLSPAGPGGAWPASMGSRLLDAGEAGTFVSWVETRGQEARLCFAPLGEAGLGEARVAASGTGWMINWADYPVLAAGADGSMAAAWLERTSQDGGWDYSAWVATSEDGQLWSDGVQLHEDASGPEYGFVSLVAQGRPGSFGAVWLDSRNMTSGHDGHDGHGGGDMALMLRSVTADGAGTPVLGPELVLDDRTCECCATSAIAAPDGGLEVAFRDRSAEEVRDIVVLGLGGGGLFERGGPASDRWQIAGCPVNGPSLVASEGLRGLAWFTMDQGLGAEAGGGPGTPTVKAAVAQDGLGFSPVVRVDEGQPLGRAAAAFDGAGALHVAWLEGASEGGGSARWLLRRVTGPGGAALADLPAARTLAETSGSRSSGFTSLAWRGGERPGFHFAFTEIQAAVSEAEPGSRVRVGFVAQ